MARPKKKIDPELVEKLAAIHCTTSEIAAVLDCSEDTLERRFAGLMRAARDRGRMSLKRKQFEMALNGDRTMLVWLGKTILKQKDASRLELSDPDGNALQSGPKHAELVSAMREALKGSGDGFE